MLANRLSVLIAERQLSIKQVVQDTGLSRNTISNIINNPESNISTETLDKLCIYFEVDPSEFFVFSPYSIELGLNSNDKIMLMSVTYHRKEQLYDLLLYISSDDFDQETDARLKSFDIYFDIVSDMGGSKVLEIYNSLPMIFKTQLTNRILKHIEDSFDMTTIEIRVMDQNDYTKTDTYNYLASLGKEVFSASIRLPWVDLEKNVTLTKNNHLKFI